MPYCTTAKAKQVLLLNRQTAKAKHNVGATTELLQDVWLTKTRQALKMRKT